MPKLQVKSAIIKKILNLHGITNFQILNPNSGYRNTSYPITTEKGKFNLIFYKSEPDILLKIKNANYISNFLADQNFPTRKTQNSILKIQSKNKTYYTCLYNYLDGETIPWEAYTKEHIKLLGKTMSNMHFSLESLEQKNLPDAIDELKDLNQRIINYFAKPEVQKAMHQKLGLKLNLKLESFNKLFEKLQFQPKQPLHLDFVRGNVLFKSEVISNKLENICLAQSSLTSKKRDVESPDLIKKSLIISGVLDFEKTAFSPRIIDIARTLAFLITDCKYKSEEKVRKYFLFSGYQKRGKIKLPSLKYLEPLLYFFWVHDFYKFLRHNPYESLEKNEHYIITSKKLFYNKILDRTIQ